MNLFLSFQPFSHVNFQVNCLFALCQLNFNHFILFSVNRTSWPASGPVRCAISKWTRNTRSHFTFANTIQLIIRTRAAFVPNSWVRPVLWIVTCSFIVESGHLSAEFVIWHSRPTEICTDTCELMVKSNNSPIKRKWKQKGAEYVKSLDAPKLVPHRH